MAHWIQTFPEGSISWSDETHLLVHFEKRVGPLRRFILACVAVKFILFR
jgi:hypothetical protein